VLKRHDHADVSGGSRAQVEREYRRLAASLVVVAPGLVARAADRRRAQRRARRAARGTIDAQSDVASAVADDPVDCGTFVRGADDP
jgi:hypothetical protein